MRKQFIIGSLLPLIFGGLIYIGLRGDNLVMFSWYDTLHINWLTDGIRDIFQRSDMNYVPNWIMYSLPGGLYMMSSVSLIMLIWHNYITPTSALWIFALPVLGILSEPCQHTGHFPGTHDFGDYILYALGVIIPIYLYKNKVETKDISYSSPSWKRHMLSFIVVVIFSILAFGADVVGSPLGEIVNKIAGAKWAGY